MEEAGSLAAHPGQEFCSVLSGTLLMHIQGRTRHAMQAGASALFDSSVSHAYPAGSSGGAKALIVSQRLPGDSPDAAQSIST